MACVKLSLLINTTFGPLWSKKMNKRSILSRLLGYFRMFAYGKWPNIIDLTS
jgi:hypothetical protein